MTATKLLARIINKGGIIGECAKVFSDNATKADLYIRECREHFHTQMADELWGSELMAEIQRYCSARVPRDKNIDEFSALVANAIKQLRKQRGIKQSLLAQVLNITQSNYSRLEDALRPMTVREFNIICEFLDTSIIEIILATDESKQTKS